MSVLLSICIFANTQESQPYFHSNQIEQPNSNLFGNSMLPEKFINTKTYTYSMPHEQNS